METTDGPGNVMEPRDANGDLGLYPIGSDCAKLARKAGHKIYNENCQEI